MQTNLASSLVVVVALLGGVAGSVSAPGSTGVSFAGPGTVQLVFAGTIAAPVSILTGAEVYIANSNALGTAPITVSTGGQLAIGAITNIAVGNDITLNGSGPGGTGALEINSPDTITLSGSLTSATSSTVSVLGSATVTLNGALAGSGALTVSGPGQFHLSGSSANTFSGGLTATNAPVFIDHSVAPGSLTLNSTSALHVLLSGTTAGTQYTQVTTPGAIALGTSTLVIQLGFIPAPGAAFTIVNNTGTTPVSGTFLSAPEGSLVTAADGVTVFRITYIGGTGHSVVLTRSSGAMVTELYTDLLQRTADAPGQQYWTAQIDSHAMARYQVVRAFLDSPERHAVFVNNLYLTYLARSAAASEQTWAINLMNAGASDEQMVRIFVESAEYFARGANSNGQRIRNFYHDLLGRSSVSDSEVSYWTGQQATGMTIDSIVRYFVNSAEGRTFFIGTVYSQDLERPLDNSGNTVFSSQMAAGSSRTDIITSVLSSDEYALAP